MKVDLLWEFQRVTILREKEIFKSIINDDYEIFGPENSLKEVAGLLYDTYNDRSVICERLRNISNDMGIRPLNRKKLLDLIRRTDDELLELNRIYCKGIGKQWVDETIENYCS